MTQKRRLLVIAFVIFSVGAALIIFRHKPETFATEIAIPSLDVRTKEASALQTDTNETHIPGIVTFENETTLIASGSGTISSIHFELGKMVSTGTVLATITNPISSTFSKDGIQSDAIRNAEITLSEARKAYKEAKRVAEKHTSHANDLARDTAKLRLESAEIALQNVQDAHILRSPVSGIVSTKNVDTGSNVSAGTTIATIAVGTNAKVKFQIPQDLMNNITPGSRVIIENTGGTESEAIVSAIAPSADSATGKIPVEAKMLSKAILPGTIVTIRIPIIQEASATQSTLLLPLSAVTTSQNESFLFVADGNHAKKVVVSIESVFGESVRIKGDFSENTSIIIDGNKRLEDGSTIRIIQ